MKRLTISVKDLKSQAVTCNNNCSPQGGEGQPVLSPCLDARETKDFFSEVFIIVLTFSNIKKIPTISEGVLF